MGPKECVGSMSRVVCQREMLEAWLRVNHPHDVMMPVVPGTKRPMFAHAAGRWSWAAHDTHLRKGGNGGALEAEAAWCVLLQDLCVVDVDSVELAADLQARFPDAMAAGPAQKTARGVHYWFARPSDADARGFFDGAAQRERGVDFKARCSTGTGGVVLVAPSPGKVWLPGRAPWQAPMSEIPSALLEAVAVARYERDGPADGGGGGESSWVDLAFSGGSEVPTRVSARCLRTMTYFAPLLEDDLLAAGAFPVPCTRAEFEDVRSAVEVGCLAGDAPVDGGAEQRARYNRTLLTADLLGLEPPSLLTRFRLGATRMAMELREIDASWADAAARPASELVAVDAALAACLTYSPPYRDAHDGWLFKALSRVAVDRGAPLLAANPAQTLAAGLPPVIKLVLASFPLHTVVAGGAVTGLVVGPAQLGADYDIFLHGFGEGEAARSRATAMMQDVHDRITGKDWRGVVVLQSACAITYLVGGARVQFVTCLFQDASEVIASFDIPVCAVFARASPSSPSSPSSKAIEVFATPAWVASVRRMAFWVDPNRKWTRTSSVRILKYVAKGFEAVVLGARTEHLRDFDDTTLRGDCSLRGLYVIERGVVASRMCTDPMRHPYRFWLSSHSRVLGLCTRLQLREAESVAHFIMRPGCGGRAATGGADHYDDDGSGLPVKEAVPTQALARVWPAIFAVAPARPHAAVYRIHTEMWRKHTDDMFSSRRPAKPWLVFDMPALMERLDKDAATATRTSTRIRSPPRDGENDAVEAVEVGNPKVTAALLGDIQRLQECITALEALAESRARRSASGRLQALWVWLRDKMRRACTSTSR